MNENRPSLFRIVQTDYATFFASALTVMFWAFLAFDTLREAEIAQRMLFIAAGITLVSILVFVWRTTTIYAIFSEGQETSAIINNVSFFRGRGTITIIHEYQGEKYIAHSRVLKNGRTKKLAVGDQVTVLVDRNNPKKAYIKDLYI